MQIANLPEDNRVISLKVAGVIDEAAPDGEAVEVLEGGWDGLCGVHAASVGTDRAETNNAGPSGHRLSNKYAPMKFPSNNNQ